MSGATAIASPRSGTMSELALSPGTMSPSPTGTTFESQPRIGRKGTYSPKGTRWRLV
jgi:hypothetical protein